MKMNGIARYVALFVVYAVMVAVYVVYQERQISPVEYIGIGFVGLTVLGYLAASIEEFVKDKRH